LITGVAGQDGSYLAEFLTGKGYRVIGTTRDARTALNTPWARAIANVELVELPEGVLGLRELIDRARPDEIYHLGGPSRVSASWGDPDGTAMGIEVPTGVVIAACLDVLPSPRVFFAGSCDVFGPEPRAQDEASPRAPESPYGRAKLDAMSLVEHAREKFGLYAVSGILFNHESPRRGPDFVTSKICRGAARIARGAKEKLTLGNLDARRDWGFAGDYVRAMWLMMFQEEPEDLVIGTGEAHSVADFCDVAFRRVGLDWREHVTTDPSLIRPSDAPLRLANPARAKARLRWTPEVDFDGLVSMMVDHELTVLS
jgi:GDPmannose 4,6-dehydratase